MRRGRILVGSVTLQADAVRGCAKLAAVRLVAIAAGDTGGKHLALLERAVVVDLVQHLSIGVVEAAGERRDDMGVGQRAAGNPVLRERTAAGVAQAAGLDLLAIELGRGTADRVAGARVDRPDDAAPLVEANQQTLARVIALAERPPALLCARPGGMP